jgi:hypothetical protein
MHPDSACGRPVTTAPILGLTDATVPEQRAQMRECLAVAPEDEASRNISQTVFGRSSLPLPQLLPLADFGLVLIR